MRNSVQSIRKTGRFLWENMKMLSQKKSTNQKMPKSVQPIRKNEQNLSFTYHLLFVIVRFSSSRHCEVITMTKILTISDFFLNLLKKKRNPLQKKKTHNPIATSTNKKPNSRITIKVNIIILHEIPFSIICCQHVSHICYAMPDHQVPHFISARHRIGR